MVMVSPTLYCGLESAVTLEGGRNRIAVKHVYLPSWIPSQIEDAQTVTDVLPILYCTIDYIS